MVARADAHSDRLQVPTRRRGKARGFLFGVCFPFADGYLVIRSFPVRFGLVVFYHRYVRRPGHPACGLSKFGWALQRENLIRGGPIESGGFAVHCHDNDVGSDHVVQHVHRVAGRRRVAVLERERVVALHQALHEGLLGGQELFLGASRPKVVLVKGFPSHVQPGGTHVHAATRHIGDRAQCDLTHVQETKTNPVTFLERLGSLLASPHTFGDIIRRRFAAVVYPNLKQIRIRDAPSYV